MNKKTRKLIRKIAKYTFLTAVGIVLFKAARVYATARRGYDAIGGEWLLLFLPVFYWQLTTMIKGMIREYAEIYAGWKEEQRRKRRAERQRARAVAEQKAAQSQDRTPVLTLIPNPEYAEPQGRYRKLS